jgi:hypothetical protein
MIFVKDPDATKFYDVDWSEWLLDGETLTAAAWTVPSGITKGATPLTDTVATVWLSGGTVGQTYPIAVRITSSLGRIDDRTIQVIIQNR